MDVRRRFTVYEKKKHIYVSEKLINNMVMGSNGSKRRKYRLVYNIF